MGANEELQELLEKLNFAAQDKFKYSAKITTNAKGEAQIHASVKSNESVEDCKTLLETLTQKVLDVCKTNGLKLPGGSA